MQLLLAAGAETVEENEVDLLSGDQRKPEFVALNPEGTVPVLKDSDGSVVCGAAATLRYLCCSRDALAGLYPSEPRARRRCDAAVDFAEGELYAKLSAVVWPICGFGQSAPTAEASERALAELSGTLAAVASRYVGGGDAFVCGSAPCVADFALAPHLVYLEYLGLEVPQEVAAYYGRFCAAAPDYAPLARTTKRWLGALLSARSSIAQNSISEQLYISLKRATVRAAPELASEKIGSIEQWQSLAVKELVRLPTGQSRARIDSGWVSVASADGRKLLQEIAVE